MNFMKRFVVHIHVGYFDESCPIIIMVIHASLHLHIANEYCYTPISKIMMQ